MNTEATTISTGNENLDAVLGGGWPRGRISELIGQEGSGRMAVLLTTIAAAQRSGGVVALIDTEHRFDSARAREVGIQLTDLLVSQPDCAEQALAIVEKLHSSGAVDLIVVNSTAALTPRAELEGDPTGVSRARILGKVLRKISGRGTSAVVFTSKHSTMVEMRLGSTGGGNALKYYASIRLELRKIDGEPGGIISRARTVKNKLAPPFKSCELEICHGVLQ